MREDLRMSNQNLSMMSQNNVNLINAIQGFNSLGQQISQMASQLGRYVTWAGTGSPAVGSAVTSTVAG